MSRTDLGTSRWLEAHCDRSADLTTLPNSLVLADVVGDGDFRLVLTHIKCDHLSSRLKVYKGTVLCVDQSLPDVPCGIISFYSDNLEPKLPFIGVACDSEFLVYKNCKPFYKFNVPTLPITALEQDTWEKLSDGELADINCKSATLALGTIAFGLLSPRSQALVNLQENEAKDFIERYRKTKPSKNAPITCVTSINRNSEDPFAVACPILATECGQIYILDPQSFAILHEARVSSSKATPTIIRASGAFDVEFRIVVACRERYVTFLRRGWLEGKNILQTLHSIVDMILIPGDGSICLATCDKMVHCYTKRGSKVWSLCAVQPITCLCLIPLKHLTIALVAVGMQGGVIHLYHGRHLVDYLTAPDTPSAIAFGQLGQEEHVMVIITMGGTINFKILKRTADFHLNREDGMSPIAQIKPLPLPKRSKLFLEQSMRERQHAIDMHQNFQQDLVRLRLLAARTMLDVNSDQSGTGNAREEIKLSAQVLGLGPTFKLILTLENMNCDKPLLELFAVFHCKSVVYKLSSYIFTIPLVPPSLTHKIETKVEENLERQNAEETGQIIRVFITRKGQAQPVLAATINMPPTDPLGYNL